jgi:serine/threonine-protein kinase
LLIIFGLCTAACILIVVLAKVLTRSSRILAGVNVDQMPSRPFLDQLLWQSDGSSGFLWTDYALDLLGIAILATVTAILWRRPQLSLRQLRVLELIGFGLMGATTAWFTYVGFRTGVLRRFASLEWEGILVLASHVSLLWFSLIIFYGMFVPNTWRRCAAVVGAMALTPFVIGAATGFADDDFDSSLLAAFLAQMGFHLIFGVVVSVYGCHKISMLRQEAFTARKLGQYQLKEKLGSGGMGEVYLAEHVLLKQPCALKLIRPERAGDPATLRRFEREVQATARLKHWNTVQIFDYGHAADGTFYYVMEYLAGFTLEQLVQQFGTLPPERVVYLLTQVCQGLREAHAHGLIHRDIKPANIMICERGGSHDVVKLLDFGLVKPVGRNHDLEQLTQEKTITGTAAYLSPEQATGQDQLDGRADVYSLGAVAYFLLTGQPPFPRENPIEMIVAHLRDPIRPPAELRPDVPTDVQAVVLRCLEKDPNRRFPTVDALRDALARCACAGRWTDVRAADWWSATASSPAPSFTTGDAPRQEVPTESFVPQ